MRRDLLLFAVLAVLAACSTERIVFGTADPADAASDASVTDRCPPITLARTFDSAEHLLASLEGYWRICGSTPLWDAPPETVGIAIVSNNAYFAAPGPAGPNVLDPASRRRLGVRSFETGVIEYGTSARTDTVDLVVALDGNALTLHDRGANVTVAFVRTSSSFL